jgi:hypothetical protein
MGRPSQPKRLSESDDATLAGLVRLLTTPSRKPAASVPALSPKQLSALNALIGDDVVDRAVRRAKRRLARRKRD